MTTAPAAITYTSMVSRETVCIALILTALNDLEVKVGDVENSYITAPARERIYTILGEEHGEDAGKKAIILRALYGLKSSGAAFRAHLCGCMMAMGYKPCLADPDLWMKPQFVDSRAYYSYILCYVDDIMVIHHDAMVLNRIDDFMKLKGGSIGDPNIYLGAKARKVQMPNCVWCYGISLSKYV